MLKRGKKNCQSDSSISRGKGYLLFPSSGFLGELEKLRQNFNPCLQATQRTMSKSSAFRFKVKKQTSLK